MRLYRVIIAAALLLCALVTDPAIAQFAPAPPDTTVDLSSVVNAALQLIAVAFTAILVPLLVIFGNKLLVKWGLENVKLNQERIDAAAQNMIGLAYTRLRVQPGQIAINVKSDIIKYAGDELAKSFAETIMKAGVPESELIAKARDIIASRIGITDASAAGAPIINTSQPIAITPASTQNVTVAAPKR